MKKTTTASTSSKEEEIAALEARLRELKSDDDLQDSRVALDEYIPVMSLLPYTLNLTTQAKGQGKRFKFSKFGEIKKIMYKDLVDIIELFQEFMASGYFYILDRRVIRAHGLDEMYSKLLTKQKIEDILSGSKGFLELFKSCSVPQQEVIVGMIIDKLKDKPDSVDLNVVDKIARITKTKIIERADEAREYFAAKKEMAEA